MKDRNNAYTRSLGKMRVTGHQVQFERNVFKLPPVDNFPSRSFEDTFVRGLQFGKPRMINVGVQTERKTQLLAKVRSVENLEKSETIISHSSHGSSYKSDEGSFSASIHFGRDQDPGEENLIHLNSELSLQIKEKEIAHNAVIKKYEEDLDERGKEIERLTLLLDEQHQELSDNNMLKENFSDLENEIELLKKVVSSKDEEIRNYEGELNAVKEKADDALANARLSFEEQLQDQKVEFEHEIEDREAKLQRLKHQIADMLNENSSERKKQIDELTQDIVKIQDECDSLKMKLKAVKNKKSCDNCRRLTSSLDDHVNLKNSLQSQINQLTEANNKLQSQLLHQTELKVTEIEFLRKSSEDEIKKKNSIIDQLKEQIADVLTESSNNRFSNYQHLLTESEKLISENKYSKERIEALEKIVEPLNQEVESFKLRLAKMENQKSILTELLSDIKKEKDENKLHYTTVIENLKLQIADIICNQSFDRLDEIFQTIKKNAAIESTLKY